MKRDSATGQTDSARRPRGAFRRALRELRRKASGWSFLQLVAVLAVLAVLFAAALPAYREYRMRAYLAEARRVADSWKKHAHAWYSLKGTWQGASDDSIGWTNPPSRHWVFGPHRYGPDGWPQESWFVATLRPEYAASGAAAAQDSGEMPDYALVLSASSPPVECGRLVHRTCGPRTGIDPRALPPDGPVLYLLGRTTGSISAGWQPAARAQSYRIQYRKQGESVWRDSSPELPAGTTSWTVQDLQEDTAYQLRGLASNQYGTTAGPILDASTLGTPPDCVTVAVGETTTTTVSLSWVPDARATFHRLRWRPNGTSTWTSTVTIPGNQTSHTVSGLQPATVYLLELSPGNSWGTPDCPETIAATRQDPDLYGVNLVYGHFYWPSSMTIYQGTSWPSHAAPNACRFVFAFAGRWYCFEYSYDLPEGYAFRLRETQSLGGQWTLKHVLPAGGWAVALPQVPYVDGQGNIWMAARPPQNPSDVYHPATYSVVTGALNVMTGVPVCESLAGDGTMVLYAMRYNNSCSLRVVYTTDGGTTWSQLPAPSGWSLSGAYVPINGAIGVYAACCVCCFTAGGGKHRVMLWLVTPDGGAYQSVPFTSTYQHQMYTAYGLMSDGTIWAHTWTIDPGTYNEQPAFYRAYSPSTNSGWVAQPPPQSSSRYAVFFSSAGVDFAVGQWAGGCGHDPLAARSPGSPWFDVTIRTCPSLNHYLPKRMFR